MNEHDSERISGLLEQDGLLLADSIDDADVVVLNTCCVRENADNKLYGQLGNLKVMKELRPDLEIMVGGCLSQKDKETMRKKAPHVDVVFGTHNVHRAVDLLHTSRENGPITEIWEEANIADAAAFPSALPVKREVDFAAWVTIQIGCDNTCAFCIVPSVRGKEISRPFGELISEIERLAADGVVEVTLLGQNVNSYGRDLTTELRTQDPSASDLHLAGPYWVSENGRRPRPLFADLLKAVSLIPGIKRIRYTSPHPKDLRPETIAAMAENEAVCSHLHLPLQAGSDRTLTAMHRGYTAERYLQRLADARQAIPDLSVTTDLIVGFPGETDEDFARTLEVVAEAEYDSAYTFIFSPREGTEAALRSDEFVSPEVISDRFAQLRAVVERSALRKHEARIGKIEEILVEGPSKKNADEYTGRTEQNKLVHFAYGEKLRPGTFVTGKIVSARTHYLRADAIEITALPTHRTRFQVTAM